MPAATQREAERRHGNVSCCISSMRQTCKVCGRLDYWNFDVPDEIWNEVVPEAYRNCAVCLGCFDAFAAKRGMKYAGSVKTVHFAGDMAALELEPISAADVRKR